MWLPQENIQQQKGETQLKKNRERGTPINDRILKVQKPKNEARLVDTKNEERDWKERCFMNDVLRVQLKPIET